MNHRVFDLVRPRAQSTSVVFSSPHSGRDYRPEFVMRTVLDPLALRSSEDAFVDRLLADAPAVGAPLFCARTPRAWVDFNRCSQELDPALIAGLPRLPLTPRISAGLGVVPRVVANGQAIYRGRLARDEAEARIAAAWHPYHRALHWVLEETAVRFGTAILIDCHSMPHEAIEAGPRSGGVRPDVVLGDRFGASADPAIVDAVEAAFHRAGLRVARNAPFAGAYITEHYGRPAQGWHVVQVEIDRALYMDERRIAPSLRFEPFRQLMRGIVAEIAALGATDLSLAAE